MEIDNVKINWAPVLESQILHLEGSFPNRGVRDTFNSIIEDLNENRIKSRLILSGKKPAGYVYYLVNEQMTDRILGNIGFVEGSMATGDRARNLLEWLIAEGRESGRFVMINDIFNGNDETSGVLSEMGFNRLDRQMMELDLRDVPNDRPPLSGEYEIEGLNRINIDEYQAVEEGAYSGSDDEILFPTVTEEKKSMARAMFEGSYGKVLTDVSRTVVRDGKLVGACVVTVGPSGEVSRGYPLVLDIFVSREHRGKGVAKALLLEAGRRASAAGYSKLYLWVNLNNEALKLYSSIGFKPSDYPQEVIFFNR